MAYHYFSVFGAGVVDIRDDVLAFIFVLKDETRGNRKYTEILVCEDVLQHQNTRGGVGGEVLIAKSTGLMRSTPIVPCIVGVGILLVVIRSRVRVILITRVRVVFITRVRVVLIVRVRVVPVRRSMVRTIGTVGVATAAGTVIFNNTGVVETRTGVFGGTSITLS